MVKFRVIEIPDARCDGKKTIYPKMAHMRQNNTHQLALLMKKNYRIPFVVLISILSLGYNTPQKLDNSKNGRFESKDGTNCHLLTKRKREVYGTKQ